MVGKVTGTVVELGILVVDVTHWAGVLVVETRVTGGDENPEVVHSSVINVDGGVTVWYLVEDVNVFSGVVENLVGVTELVLVC